MRYRDMGATIWVRRLGRRWLGEPHLAAGDAAEPAAGAARPPQQAGRRDQLI